MSKQIGNPKLSRGPDIVFEGDSTHGSRNVEIWIDENVCRFDDKYYSGAGPFDDVVDYLMHVAENDEVEAHKNLAASYFADKYLLDKR